MSGRDLVFQGSNVRGVLGSTYTNRRVDVEGRYPEAQRWIDTHDSGPNTNLEHEMLGSLVAATDEALSAPLYRGRFLVEAPKSPVDVFGPPQSDTASAGRYNAQGVAVLYLCSSVEGVRRELGMPPAGTALWVQRYLPLSGVRIADTRGFPVASLTQAIFYLIESVRPDPTRGDRHPTLGHRLAEIIGAHFDGILVPGVRGDECTRYWNAAIFRPRDNDRWRKMVDEADAPVVIAAKTAAVCD